MLRFLPSKILGSLCGYYVFLSGQIIGRIDNAGSFHPAYDGLILTTVESGKIAKKCEEFRRRKGLRG